MVYVIIVLGNSHSLGKKEKEKNAERKEKKIENRRHSYSRLMKAIEVFNSIESNDKLIVCTGGFGQAESMKQFLIERSIHPTQIFEEPNSKNTIENCIFSYQMLSKFLKAEYTVEELNGIDEIEKESIRKLELVDTSFVDISLVTNDYHIHRSNSIFNYFIPHLNNPNVKIVPYSANMKDFIQDLTKEDEEEIASLFTKDLNITNSLFSNISRYLSLYPFI
jgi:uncharacterized SAM-binding protein YcdF (DUF218 family)